MKVRTPIMAFNKTSLHGQLHSSGPEMTGFIKLSEVKFQQGFQSNAGRCAFMIMEKDGE